MYENNLELTDQEAVREPRPRYKPPQVLTFEPLADGNGLCAEGASQAPDALEEPGK